MNVKTLLFWKDPVELTTPWITYEPFWKVAFVPGFTAIDREMVSFDMREPFESEIVFDERILWETVGV